MERDVLSRSALSTLERLSKSPWTYVIVVATLALLWVVLVSRQTPEAIFYGGDPKQYWGLASSLLRTGEYSYYEPHTRMRPPLYPMFLAAVRFAFGDSLLPVQLAQLLLLLSAFAGVYLIARSAQGPRAGLVAVLLCAVSVPLLQQTIMVGSDILFTTLFIWATYLVYVAARRGSGLLAAFAGGAWGLTTLTRSTGALMMLVAVGVLAGFRPRKLLLTGLLVLGFAVVVFPWATRNWTVGRGFTIFGTDGGWGFWDASLPSEAVMWDQLAPDRFEKRHALIGNRFEWSEEADAMFYRGALENIAADPLGYLVRNSVKLFLSVLWVPYLYSETRLGALGPLFSGAVTLLNLLALAFAYAGARANWGRHRLWVAYPGLSVVFFWAIHFPFFINLRYFYPAEMLLFVLAAAGFAGLLEKAAGTSGERHVEGAAPP